MKVGIICDSHDAHENILKAVKIFKEQKVKYIFHGGDIIAPFSAEAFADVDARFIAVFGNNDGEKLILASTIKELGGEVYEDSYSGMVGGKRIFMTHRPGVVEDIAASGRFDLVIYGHTHKQDIRKVGNTLIINPGESTDWLSGESYVVVLELDDMSYQLFRLG